MRNFQNKRYVVLGCIVLLAIVLRVWNIGKMPPSLSWDEVSIGYNAYSILKTGRDEHGRFLPLDTFVAFGDYKPPIPIYLTIPFVAVFGLNELAVRLPSVIAGTLTVLLTYFLVQELFGKWEMGSGKMDKEVRNEKKPQSFPHRALTSHLSLLTSFLLAISPWHLMLSRAGFEANIATFFMVLGAWMVLRARHEPRFLLWCWLPFAAGIYTFNSARYFGPLFALILFLFCQAGFGKHKRRLAAGLLIAVAAILPILPHLLSKESRLRFQEVSIFNDLSIVIRANARMEADGNPWWGRIIHNRRIGYARSYLTHFFDHFEPRFLFIRGDGNPKFSIQDVGQLYLIEAPFLLVGVLCLFARHPRVAWLLLLWILSAIAPAAAARETPHALRIENSLPTWQVFIAYGISYQLSVISYQTQKKILLGIISIFYIVSFSYFWHNYINHYSKEYASEWQYGYREAIRFIEPIKNQYDTIVVTEAIGRPYIYVLFYEQYDPKKFSFTKDAFFDIAGFYNVAGFDKYRFTRQGVGAYPGRVLYVLRPQEVPQGVKVLETIRLPRGEPVLSVFEL